MSDERTEKLAKKVDALIKDAVDKDGMVTTKITLAGDGVVHKGEKPGVCFEEGDEFVTTAASARSLAIAGYVSIAKPKAAKKASEA